MHILGHGDIASALKEIDGGDKIYFASGVSNSAETRQSEFNRERDLFLKTVRANRAAHIVYFSSLSVFYADTSYTRHKRSMEWFVKSWSRTSTIVRIGNITWGTNPHTLINYLRNQMLRGEVLNIQNTERYIVDYQEFIYWIKMIPEWSCELNIPGERMTVAEVVTRYVMPYAHEIRKIVAA